MTDVIIPPFFNETLGKNRRTRRSTRPEDFRQGPNRQVKGISSWYPFGTVAAKIPWLHLLHDGVDRVSLLKRSAPTACRAAYLNNGIFVISVVL